jgi:cell division protein FtsL
MKKTLTKHLNLYKMTSTEKLVTFLLFKFHLLVFIFFFYYKIIRMDLNTRRLIRERDEAEKMNQQAIKEKHRKENKTLFD